MSFGTVFVSPVSCVMDSRLNNYVKQIFDLYNLMSFGALSSLCLLCHEQSFKQSIHNTKQLQDETSASQKLFTNLHYCRRSFAKLLSDVISY